VTRRQKKRKDQYTKHKKTKVIGTVLAVVMWPAIIRKYWNSISVTGPQVAKNKKNYIQSFQDEKPSETPNCGEL